MKTLLKLFSSVVTLLAMFATTTVSWAQEATTTSAVPVRIAVTANTANHKRLPTINPEDVVVKQGKERLPVTEWVTVRGDRAGLDLFILIDDASSTSLGSHLNDLRAFVNSQPSNTAIGIGYMRNATVQIVRDFTTNHAAAAKAIRLPLGNAGAYGSPYLSIMDLMKRWPENQNRREVVMLTDGIDRARGGPRWRGLSPNPDVDTASEAAMRTGTIIHTIYAPGTGRLSRNYWEATNGQMNMARLADITGGESYYLGLQRPVSIKPYLDDLQRVLDNRYWLSFSVQPGTQAGLQHVSLSTGVAGVEFSAPDAVWVPAAQ
jgi:hypothetical protein